MGVRQSHFSFKSLPVRFAFNRITRRAPQTVLSYVQHGKATNDVRRLKALPHQAATAAARRSRAATPPPTSAADTTLSASVMAEP